MHVDPTRTSRVFASRPRLISELPPCPQVSFTHSWGVSYGVGQLSEWQDIANEAIQGVAVLFLLDQLRLVNVDDWLERHLDILSIQSVLLLDSEAGTPLWRRIWAYRQYMGRVE